MMPNVKRYDLEVGQMSEYPDGAYVKAADYDTLRAAAKALAAEVQAADVHDLGVSVALDAWYALTDEAVPRLQVVVNGRYLTKGAVATVSPGQLTLTGCDAEDRTFLFAQFGSYPSNVNLSIVTDSGDVRHVTGRTDGHTRYTNGDVNIYCILSAGTNQ
jgi:hypothetical protein